MNPSVIRIGICDRAIVARLMDEARRLNCRPEQLALALVSCGIEMPDAVLDGASPAQMHPQAGERASRLTAGQRALLAILAARADADGLVQLTEAAAAEALGIKYRGAVWQRFGGLASRGCIEIVRKGTRGRKGGGVYRVTERGRAMAGGGAA